MVRWVGTEESPPSSYVMFPLYIGQAFLGFRVNFMFFTISSDLSHLVSVKVGQICLYFRWSLISAMHRCPHFLPSRFSFSSFPGILF